MSDRDKQVTAYHMNDWINREARLAERVALVTDTDFEFLRRDEEYIPNALERNPPISSFVSWFNQAHATGFTEELSEGTDLILSGYDAPEMVSSMKAFPTYQLNIGMGILEIPVMKRTGTPEDYLDVYLGKHLKMLDIKDHLEYVNKPLDIRKIIKKNVREEDGSISYHGVKYKSLRDFIISNDYYPSLMIRNISVTWVSYR